VSGRRVLNVNPQFTVRLRGLKDDESQTVLNFLYDRAKIPEYQMRVRWTPNTVLVWDNRSVQHYAPHDYYPQRRTMDRLTIAGEPVGGVTGPYTPEAGVEPLPDGHGTKPVHAGKAPTREFERY
jgi:taurine dioxygenase